MNEAIQQVKNGFYRWSNTVGIPGVWTGTGHGHLHVKGNEVIVFDPPEMTEGQFEELQKIGKPIAVLLTSDWHDRSSDLFSSRYNVPVYALAETAPHCDCTVHRTFASGDELPGGWLAIVLPIEGETIFHGVTVFYSEESGGVMVTGDAVIGGEDGTAYLHDREHVAPLRCLLDYDFETILTGHGSDLLSDAKGELAAAISEARIVT